MKINLERGIITMGRSETRAWESGDADAWPTCERVKAAAIALANRLKKPVEVYACAARGGWMADQIQPDVKS